MPCIQRGGLTHLHRPSQHHNPSFRSTSLNPRNAGVIKISRCISTWRRALHVYPCLFCFTSFERVLLHGIFSGPVYSRTRRSTRCSNSSFFFWVQRENIVLSCIHVILMSQTWFSLPWHPPLMPHPFCLCLPHTVQAWTHPSPGWVQNGTCNSTSVSDGHQLTLMPTQLCQCSLPSRRPASLKMSL